MKYCIYCGAQLPDVAIFCSKCGQRVEEAEAAPVKAPAPAAQTPATAPVAAQPAPAPVSQPIPAPQPAQPAPAPVPAQPVSAPQSAQVRSGVRGLRYADMQPVNISMQDKYNMPKTGYTPPPYVLAPEKDSRTTFLANHFKDVTSAECKLNDQPGGRYRTDVTLELCSDYLRITIMESLLLVINWEWVALTFDTIRRISTFTDGRLQGMRIEFTDPDCHPVSVTSKSKHFPELVNRLAYLAGLPVARG